MIQQKRTIFNNLGEKEMQQLYDLAQPYLNHRIELYNRYRRKDSPYKMMSAGNKSLAAWERYIIVMADGAFAGVSPQYTTSGDDADIFQEILDSIRRYNDDSSVYTEAMHYYNTTGAAYLFVSEDEHNEIVYHLLNPLSTVIVYDYGIPPRPIAALLFRQNNDDKLIEIITPNSRTVRNMKGELVPFEDYGADGKIQEITEKELYWDGLLPVIPFEQKDGIAMFEPVIPLIDAFENMLTNAKNMTQYNDNAKLVVKGHQSEESMYTVHTDEETGKTVRVKNPAWTQEVNDLYQAPAVYFPNDGDMRWLIKDISYDGIISFLREIIELILTLSITPNLTDSKFSGNSSGVAISYKLFALEQMGATIYGVFKKGYSSLLELVVGRLNLRGNTKYDWRDVEITFEQNIPMDENQRINMITTAFRFGAISQETATALAAAALGVDASDEVERVNLLNTKNNIQ